MNLDVEDFTVLYVYNRAVGLIEAGCLAVGVLAVGIFA
jgi:hypothetical protein